MKIENLLRRVLRGPGQRPARPAAPSGDLPDMHNQSLVSVVGALRSDHPSLGPVRRSQVLHERSVDQLTARVREILGVEFRLPVDRDLRRDIQEFYELLGANPARMVKKGATGDGKNIWLHLIARVLQPELIVESGVFVGRSLYTLRTAVPGAEMHAFDISFKPLRFRDHSIQYHERDWSEVEVRCAGRRGLCYFDDHINNGRRIREAYDRGFRHLIFDDCQRIGLLHQFRYPGVPTAMMIAHDELQAGDVIEWEWKDEKLRYTFDPSHAWGAEDLIDFVAPLPSLEDWLGESPGPAAYVRLKD